MLETRYLSERALRGERSWRLLRYLLDRGADEWTIEVMALRDTLAPFADAFEDEMAPFERQAAPRPMWDAETRVVAVRPVRLWTLDERSLTRLRSFLDEGLFHSPPGPDGWLENLAVFRAGELVLGVASHEGEAVLRLTAREHAEVTALGTP
ncbi:MAG: hypothetical protein HOQ11_17690 [Gemmatimonadaceae bacterium]|nr:hypothetical protein [Gemmatimonadaceae bacterium]NUQ94688.1 hypothetical protein [Gemmatimonadaceae bacterium]NUR34134.1 hypothetical protein [Gemmatimonadaceae bacterium]NUS99238.1 hypothetical protein [Gemmatimonadaceae bacterium]